ncbi:Uma2 family endonuclease [Streptantibioticus ferralitis]|uniref:Uma2 family endonuclease n=1 Tax=Streptantibioticus ferralitis TaxID=236510 RepID=A0ABT5Z1Y6_9ACTN|nr:Uma2 family endonuclease [Streptantibioticus ferralitis]MDF2257854.1 Uma2 family endonuclease [Streptantibioticus ferralitis]
MSALSVEHEPENGYGWDELVRLWEETDWPEGCLVEIIEGIITVAPAPSKRNALTATRLARQVDKVIPEDWGVFQNLAGAVPVRQGLYIPDLAVFAHSVLEAPGPANYVPLDEAQLVVEITSGRNANHDRVEKLRGYAMAEVPFYLLLDPWHSGAPTATLYGEPRNGMYRVLAAVKYGEELHLPAPFDLTIDTSVFPGA